MDAEHQFWLNILQDHLIFINEALTVQEDINRCQNLLEQLKSLSTDSLPSISSCVNDIIEFKKYLLTKKLTEAYDIRLGSTFISHMISEAEEYKLLLEEGEVILKHELHYHKLWLFDGKYHLEQIKNNIDGIEGEIKQRLSQVEKKNRWLIDKLLEILNFIKTVPNFEGLRKFNNDASNDTKSIVNLISEISELWDSGSIQGSLTPLMIDHMLREQNYYLTKI